MLLEKSAQSETGVTRIVERLLMLVPNERYRQDNVAPGLEDAVHFCQEFVRIEDVLQNLVAQERVEGRIPERKAVAIIVAIGDSHGSCPLGLDIKPHVLFNGEQSLVGLPPAPHLEDSAA